MFRRSYLFYMMHHSSARRPITSSFQPSRAPLAARPSSNYAAQKERVKEQGVKEKRRKRNTGSLYSMNNYNAPSAACSSLAEPHLQMGIGQCGYGGVYMDLDMNGIKTMDDILTHRYLDARPRRFLGSIGPGH